MQKDKQIQTGKEHAKVMNSSILRQINDLYFKIQNLCNELCYFLLFDYNVMYLTDFLYQNINL